MDDTTDTEDTDVLRVLNGFEALMLRVEQLVQTNYRLEKDIRGLSQQVCFEVLLGT